MSLESDIRSLLADRNWAFISAYEFECSVVHLVHRKVVAEKKRLAGLQKTSLFDLLCLWKEFLGCFMAFHLLTPLTPLGKAPEIFGVGTTLWFFTILPVSLFFSLVLSIILKKP